MTCFLHDGDGSLEKRENNKNDKKLKLKKLIFFLKKFGVGLTRRDTGKVRMQCDQIWPFFNISKVFGIFRGAFRFGHTCEAFPLLPNGQMSASSKEPGCIGTQSQAFPALRHPLYHSADLTPEQCFVRGLLKFVFRQNLQK